MFTNNCETGKATSGMVQIFAILNLQNEVLMNILQPEEIWLQQHDTPPCTSNQNIVYIIPF
jgi:hypothetical protein